MGWCAILEGAIEAAEALLHGLPVQPDDLESPHHGFRQMVADAAGGNLIAIADQIVLEGLDRERVFVVQRVDAALRHRERVVAEVDALFVLVPLIERKIDDPAKLKAIAVDEVQFLTCPGARRTGEGREFLRVSCDEECRVTIRQAKLLADRLGALLADVLGDRARALELVAFLAPENVAETGLALALRPGIHAVAKGARATGLCRNGPD